MRRIHRRKRCLSYVISAAKAQTPHLEQQAPAVPIRTSVTPDYFICLEDGKKFRTLKKHLRTDHDLTPDEYREKWRLPHDYPLVAPSYSAAHSALAHELDLGRTGRRG